MGGRGSKKMSGGPMMIRDKNPQNQGIKFPGEKPRRPKLITEEPQDLTTGKSAGGDTVPRVNAKSINGDTEAFAAHDKYMKAYEQWAKGLPTDEKSALIAYQGSAYGDMNSNLRDIQKGAMDPGHVALDTKQYIRQATAALDKTSLQQDTIAWRRTGVKMTYEDALKKVGETEVDPAFTSTSLNKEFVLNPGSSYSWGYTSNYDKNVPVVYRFMLPQGAKAGYIQAATDSTLFSSERELLIQRGSRYKITKATLADHPTIPGKHAIILDAVYLGSPKSTRIAFGK